MQLGTIIVVLMLILLVAFCIRNIINNHQKGGCSMCDGCSGCKKKGAIRGRSPD